MGEGGGERARESMTGNADEVTGGSISPSLSPAPLPPAGRLRTRWSTIVIPRNAMQCDLSELWPGRAHAY